MHYSVHPKDRAEWGACCCSRVKAQRGEVRAVGTAHTFDRTAVTCVICLGLTEMRIKRRRR